MEKEIVDCTNKEKKYSKCPLNRVVDEFLAEWEEKLKRESHFYEIQPSLESAIRVSALCVMPSGKRHSHQRRIPEVKLKKLESSLQEERDRIGKADIFHDLFTIVKEAADPIPGIGELTVYDVAHRIGKYLRVKPDYIYLHAGTRIGANHLSIGKGKEYSTLVEIPDELRVMTPENIEDFLCICKEQLRRVKTQ
jgi:hypothetical protein